MQPNILNIEEIKSEVAKAANKLLGDKLIKVFLYGSFARGDFDSESDIDFALISKVSENDIPSYNEKVGQIISDLSIKYGILVSLMIISSDTFVEYKKIMPFYVNILREGVIVYG